VYVWGVSFVVVFCAFFVCLWFCWLVFVGVVIFGGVVCFFVGVWFFEFGRYVFLFGWWVVGFGVVVVFLVCVVVLGLFFGFGCDVVVAGCLG